ncbi:MAG: LacI family DNA-binding transcriptional regulator, partial [bacterium]
MSSYPTLKDVARVADVDPSTASFVINGKGDKLRISHATQTRVLAAVRDLGYSPRHGGEAEKSQEAEVGKVPPEIGLVLSATSPVETLALLPGLEPALFAAGYKLVVITVSTDPVADRERVSKSGVAGIICCRTLYPVISEIMVGKCPVIVLWEGAAKAMLARLAGAVVDPGEPGTAIPAPA